MESCHLRRREVVRSDREWITYSIAKKLAEELNSRFGHKRSAQRGSIIPLLIDIYFTLATIYKPAMSVRLKFTRRLFSTGIGANVRADEFRMTFYYRGAALPNKSRLVFTSWAGLGLFGQLE